MLFVLEGGELRTDPGEQVEADTAPLTAEVYVGEQMLFWGGNCGLTAAAGFAELLGLADPSRILCMQSISTNI
jgi:hypothetical protein